MFRFRILAAVLASIVPGILVAPARSAFHLWKVQEVFTNADGSVQFIELVNGSATGEHFISGHFIRSTADGVATSFTIPSNLPNPPSTANRHVLFATPSFATIAGVTPDYTIPTSFINPNATNYTLAFDTLDTNFSFTSALFPTDGIKSLMDLNPAGTLNLTVVDNSPTNFLNVTGAVPPPVPENNGDYNGDLVVNAADYTVWRNTLGSEVETSSGADGNNNGMIDSGDYTFWRDHYGELIGGAGAIQGGFANVPEPNVMKMLFMGIIGLSLFWRGTRRASAVQAR